MSTARSTRLRGLAARSAALLVGAAALPLSVALGVATAGPAAAASCGGAEGVTVVVDFGALGGGVQAGCDPSADGRAAQSFSDAGFNLSWATKDAGFVCRVNGKPASDPCTDAAPSDAYWSLWWADGKGGSWVYSSRGTGNLRAPEGGYVAFSWHQGNGLAQPPAVNPTVRVSAPTPAPTSSAPAPGTPGKASPTPTRKPAKPAPTRAPSATKKPAPARPSATPGSQAPTSTAPSTGAPTEAASSTPSAVATGTPTGTVAPTEPGQVVTPSATDPGTGLPEATSLTTGPDDVAPTAGEPDSDGGLPLWLPIGLVAVLLAAGGVVAVRRRAD